MAFLIVTSNHSSIFFTPICWPQNLHRKIGSTRNLDLHSFTFHPDAQLVLRHIAMSHLDSTTRDLRKLKHQKEPGFAKTKHRNFPKVNFKKRGARSRARQWIFWFWNASGRMDGLTNHQQDSWYNPIWESCLELWVDLVYLKWKHINHHRSKSLFPKCLLL